METGIKAYDRKFEKPYQVNLIVAADFIERLLAQIVKNIFNFS